jgi:glycosyltransferase involved in cell wall biosynthesis
MVSRINISYVVAAHNSALVIESTVRKIHDELSARDFSFEILVVENASSDDTYAICKKLEDHFPSLQTLQSEKGLGAAFRKGMLAANGELVIATADDLPFGFSDLDQYMSRSEKPAICIGSKGLPASEVSRSLLRSVASAFFLGARFLILGLKIRDTQGTYLVQRQVARDVAEILTESNYIYTTEFAYVGQNMGYEILELPVKAEPELRNTTVRVVRDGIDMCKGLIRIRCNHRPIGKAN